MYRVLFSLLFLLTSFGCKTENVRESASPSVDKPYSDHFVVRGSANLGVLSEGIVKVYPLINGRVDLNLVIGTATTDGDGLFEVEVDNKYKGFPSALRVVASSITCTLSAGCPHSVPFGGKSDGENIELFLLVPNLNERRAYSINIFTHIAYQDFAAASHENDALISNAYTQYLIAIKNMEVSNRFGVIGDISSLCDLDTTQSAMLRQADSINLRCSVLGSAVVQAMRNFHPDEELSELVDAFSDQFVKSGLPGRSSSRNTISFADIMRESVEVASFLQARHGIDFSNLISEFSVARGLALSEDEDLFLKGGASQTAGLTLVERGKAFVSDIRRVATSLDLRKIAALGSISGFLSGDAASALTQFGFKLNTTDALQGKQIDHAYEVLQRAIAASFFGLIDFYAGKPLPASRDGLLFTHLNNGGNHVFAFVSPIDLCSDNKEGCTVQPYLRVVLDAKRFSANVGSQFVTAESLGVLVIGSITSGDLVMEFQGGEQQFMVSEPALMLEEKTFNGWVESSYLFEGDAIRVHLPILIEKSGDQEFASINAVISGQADKLSVRYADRKMAMPEESGAIMNLREQSFTVSEVLGFQIGFAVGMVDSEEGNSFGALSVKQGLGKVPEYLNLKISAAESCTNAWADSICEELSSETIIEGESDETFLRLAGSAAVTASLKGMSTPVMIEMTGSRNSPVANTIDNLRVSYPGHAVNINGQFNRNGGIVSLDAKNLEGMHLYFNTVSGKRIGALESIEKEKVADITDMGQWVKVRYINGEFESL